MTFQVLARALLLSQLQETNRVTASSIFPLLLPDELGLSQPGLHSSAEIMASVEPSGERRQDGQLGKSEKAKVQRVHGQRLCCCSQQMERRETYVETQSAQTSELRAW